MVLTLLGRKIDWDIHSSLQNLVSIYFTAGCDQNLQTKLLLTVTFSELCIWVIWSCAYTHNPWPSYILVKCSHVGEIFVD